MNVRTDVKLTEKINIRRQVQASEQEEKQLPRDAEEASPRESQRKKVNDECIEQEVTPSEIHSPPTTVSTRISFSLSELLYKYMPMGTGLHSPISDKPSVIYSHFTQVALPHSFSEYNPPKKILALDMDNTLVYFNKSREMQKQLFVNFEETQKYLRKAIDNQFMIVLVTTRPHNEIEHLGLHYLSINQLLRNIGLEYFSCVFFTASHCKNYALHYLYEKYLAHHHSNSIEGRGKICLVDDTLSNCSAASFEKFAAIMVDRNNAYLSQIDTFISQEIKRPEEKKRIFNLR